MPDEDMQIDGQGDQKDWSDQKKCVKGYGKVHHRHLHPGICGHETDIRRSQRNDKEQAGQPQNIEGFRYGV